MSFFDEQVFFITAEVILDELYAVCPICNNQNLKKTNFEGRISIQCKDCADRIDSFYQISLGNLYSNRISAFKESIYDFVPKKNHWRTRVECFWASGLLISKDIAYDTYRHSYTVVYGNQSANITPLKFIKKFSVKDWKQFMKKMDEFSRQNLYR